jgi:signal peptidase complex subunit 3
VHSVRGRPHYYSTKKEEYAHIRFDLDADLSSLFTWNTKQVFVWISATWPNANATAREMGVGPNEAVIWDAIYTSPSADYLRNMGVTERKKLERERAKKGFLESTTVDKSR